MAGIELTPEHAVQILVSHLETGEMDNVPNTMMEQVRSLAKQVSQGENGDALLWRVVIPHGFDENLAERFRVAFVKAICSPNT